MAKKSSDNRFQTHIAEPRWQVILSLVLVLGGALFWLAMLIWNS
jgi:hypothetical protein